MPFKRARPIGRLLLLEPVQAPVVRRSGDDVDPRPVALTVPSRRPSRKLADRRLRILLVVFAVVFAVTLARAAWLQTVQASRLAGKGASQQRETFVVPAGRGTGATSRSCGGAWSGPAAGIWSRTRAGAWIRNRRGAWSCPPAGIRIRNRAGAWTPLMAPVVSKLNEEDMLNAAAYLASLQP